MACSSSGKAGFSFAVLKAGFWIAEPTATRASKTPTRQTFYSFTICRVGVFAGKLPARRRYRRAVAPNKLHKKKVLCLRAGCRGQFAVVGAVVVAGVSGRSRGLCRVGCLRAQSWATGMVAGERCGRGRGPFSWDVFRPRSRVYRRRGRGRRTLTIFSITPPVRMQKHLSFDRRDRSCIVQQQTICTIEQEFGQTKYSQELSRRPQRGRRSIPPGFGV